MIKYLTLFFLLVFVGCGSRKAEIKKEEKKIEISTIEKSTFVDTSNVEIKTNIETETIIVEAKDNFKPFTYEGKTYFNVVLRKQNKKDNTLFKKNVKVTQTNQKRSNIKVNETKKEKKTEKESDLKYYFLFFFFLLIIIFYILNRKYKIDR